MKVNVDIGERGPDHPVDLELMNWIDIANVACGGHAGDEVSIRVFSELAEEKGVQVSAHLSYPDREGFGRRSMHLSEAELIRSLDLQLRGMPGVDRIKFHGALYNECVVNPELASVCASWLAERGVRTVICPAGSELAAAVSAQYLTVLPEAFAERRYQFDSVAGLTLVPRSHPRSVLTELSEAVDQVQRLIANGEVRCLDGEIQPIFAETLCIHSDSPIALELVKVVVACKEKRS